MVQRWGQFKEKGHCGADDYKMLMYPFNFIVFEQDGFLKIEANFQKRQILATVNFITSMILKASDE